MPRKKAQNQDEILSHPIIIRITETAFNRLEDLRKESHYTSIGEVARRILSNRKVKLFYKDSTMDAPLEEMALIRKELKAIGININQLTRGFNQDKHGTRQAYYLMKAGEQYQQVGEKVERLLALISKLAEQWLARS